MNLEKFVSLFEGMVGRAPERSEVDEMYRLAPADAGEAVYSSLAFHRRYKTLDYYSRWVITPVFGGSFKMWINLADKFVSYGCLIDDYEPHITRTITELSQNGGLFVDVGANLGWHTLGAIRSQATVSVCAFEPSAVVRSKLADTLKLNNLLSRVELRSNALGSNSREVSLCTPSLSNLGHTFVCAKSDSSADVHIIRQNRLDDEQFDNRIYCIKIDTEGYDFDVLIGAINYIKYWRPTIIMEYEYAMWFSYGRFIRELFVLTSELNYKIHLSIDDRWHEINDDSSVSRECVVALLLTPGDRV